MTAEQVKDRLHEARNRIHKELDDLATMDDPHRTIARVEVAARLVP